MKKILLVSSLLFSIALLSVQFSACSCKCEEDNNFNIPERIILAGEQFIASKTGTEYYNAYIRFDPINSKNIESFFELRFIIEIPDKPFFNGKILFYADSTGTVLTDKDITGIPECLLDPTNCDFQIDEAHAIAIASEAGLSKGIKDWKSALLWNAKHKKYLWHVLSTLSEAGGQDRYIAKGQEVLINPASGEMIEFNSWNIR